MADGNTKEFLIIVKQWARVYPKDGAAGWRGRLYVTDLRLIFEARFMARRKLIIWPYNEIAKIAKVDTLGLIPNALRITMKSGAKDTLVVWPRDSAINAFNDFKLE